MSIYKYDSTNDELIPICSGTVYSDCPVGTILSYGGLTPPSNGYLLCNGQAISRTTYKDLFDVIGTNFGSGDGSTTFNLPDLRGEFLRGAGTNSHSGQGNGGTVGQHQDGTSNGTWFDVGGSNYLYFMENANTGYRNAPTNTDTVSSDQGTNSRITLQGTLQTASGDYATTYTTRPTNTSVNYIIKAKTVALPLDIQADLASEVLSNTVDSVTDGEAKPVSSNAVFDAINDIQTTSITLTIGSGTNNTMTLNLYKCGHVIQGVAAVQSNPNGINTTIGDWFTIGTLPTGYRPKSMMFVTFTHSNSRETEAMVRIDTNGTMAMYKYTSGNFGWERALNFTFVVD